MFGVLQFGLEPSDWKGAGNAFFKAGEMAQALRCYCNSMAAMAASLAHNADQRRLLCDVMCNMSASLLRMGDFSWAAQISEFALHIEPHALKSWQRYMSALEASNKNAAIGKSCGLIEKVRPALQIETVWSSDADKQSLKDLFHLGRAAGEKYRRLTSTEFIMKNYTSGITQPPKEPTYYVGPMELHFFEGKGYGWVATSDIPAGTLLLVDTPIAISTQSADDVKCEVQGNNDVWSSLVKRLMSESVCCGVAETVAAVTTGKHRVLLKQLLQYRSLKGKTSEKDIPLDYLKSESKRLNVDFSEALNIYKFVTNNTHNLRPQRSSDLCATGLYMLSSYFNHSCWPNSCRVEVGQLLYHHALTHIGIGEEITETYTPLFIPKGERREVLQSVYGFLCRCDACCPGEGGTQRIVRSLMPPSRFGTPSEDMIPTNDSVLATLNPMPRSPSVVDVDTPRTEQFINVQEPEGAVKPDPDMSRGPSLSDSRDRLRIPLAERERWMTGCVCDSRKHPFPLEELTVGGRLPLTLDCPHCKAPVNPCAAQSILEEIHVYMSEASQDKIINLSTKQAAQIARKGRKLLTDERLRSLSPLHGMLCALLESAAAVSRLCLDTMAKERAKLNTPSIPSTALTLEEVPESENIAVEFGETSPEEIQLAEIFAADKTIDNVHGVTWLFHMERACLTQALKIRRVMLPHNDPSTIPLLLALRQVDEALKVHNICYGGGRPFAEARFHGWIPKANKNYQLEVVEEGW